MFVNGTCPPKVIQLKIANDPDTHQARLAGERTKARLGLRVNLAGWSGDTGASISAEEV